MDESNYLINGIRLVGKIKFCEIIEKIYKDVEYGYNEKGDFIIFWYGDYYLWDEKFDVWYLLIGGEGKKVIYL